MSLLSICEWLQHTQFSTGIRESEWVFPAIEGTHILNLATSVGTIMFVDLRLIGVSMKRIPIRDVIEPLQPWTLSGFAVTFLTGILLFSSEPLRCYHSAFFNLKFLLLGILGVNALVFHRTIYRSVAKWNDAVRVPYRARMAGYFSLALWSAVIVLGRGIAYTAAH